MSLAPFRMKKSRLNDANTAMAFHMASLSGKNKSFGANTIFTIVESIHRLWHLCSA